MNVKGRIFLMLVICLILCAACQQTAIPSVPNPTATIQPTQAPALNRDTEEIAVYSALLKDSFRGDIEQFLIVDQTRVPSLGLMNQNLAEF